MSNSVHSSPSSSCLVLVSSDPWLCPIARFRSLFSALSSHYLFLFECSFHVMLCYVYKTSDLFRFDFKHLTCSIFILLLNSRYVILSNRIGFLDIDVILGNRYVRDVCVIETINLIERERKRPSSQI